MSYVDIVFDGELGPDGPVFVETEDDQGRGIKLGSWFKRDDDYWVLRVPLQELSSIPGNNEFLAEVRTVVQRWWEENDSYSWNMKAIERLIGIVDSAQQINRHTSDGHHTFDELYDYRMLYNAHAAHGWLAAGINVVKSWRHSDGEKCFGGGWFIVTAELPTGQVSNHYRTEYWDLFQVPDEPLAPEYDGHTPALAAQRLRVMLEAGL